MPDYPNIIISISHTYLKDFPMLPYDLFECDDHDHTYNFRLNSSDFSLLKFLKQSLSPDIITKIL